MVFLSRVVTCFSLLLLIVVTAKLLCCFDVKETTKTHCLSNKRIELVIVLWVSDVRIVVVTIAANDAVPVDMFLGDRGTKLLQVGIVPPFHIICIAVCVLCNLGILRIPGIAFDAGLGWVADRDD